VRREAEYGGRIEEKEGRKSGERGVEEAVVCGCGVCVCGRGGERERVLQFQFRHFGRY